MIPYSFVQLVFFFITYCVAGWIIESTYVSIKEKKFVNRGFMRGPVIPIYGSGAMMLLLCSAPFLKYPIAVFFAGLIGASVLEYITGAVMEAIFKVRYWDYTEQPFNIHGYVCLGTSLCWGVLSVVLNYYFHKPVEKLSTLMSSTALKAVTIIASIVFIVDLTLSVKAALDLRAIIIKLEKAKDEMRLMQKRLDVMLAFYAGSIKDYAGRATDKIDDFADKVESKMEKFSDGFSNRIDVLTDNIEDRFVKIKSYMESAPEKVTDSLRNEYYELKARFKYDKDEGSVRQLFKNFYLKGIFTGNPSLKSERFEDTIKEVKSKLNKPEK